MARLDKNRQSTEQMFRLHPRTDRLQPIAEVIEGMLVDGGKLDRLPCAVPTLYSRSELDVAHATEQQMTTRRVALCHFVLARAILGLSLSDMLYKTIGDGYFTSNEIESVAYGISGRLETPRCEI